MTPGLFYLAQERLYWMHDIHHDNREQRKSSYIDMIFVFFIERQWQPPFSFLPSSCPLCMSRIMKMCISGQSRITNHVRYILLKPKKYTPARSRTSGMAQHRTIKRPWFPFIFSIQFAIASIPAWVAHMCSCRHGSPDYWALKAPQCLYFSFQPVVQPRKCICAHEPARKPVD